MVRFIMNGPCSRLAVAPRLGHQYPCLPHSTSGGTQSHQDWERPRSRRKTPFCYHLEPWPMERTRISASTCDGGESGADCRSLSARVRQAHANKAEAETKLAQAQAAEQRGAALVAEAESEFAVCAN